MQRNNRDGGPAFPVLEPGRQGVADTPTKNPQQHFGMSLRDWFAGQTLVALASARGEGVNAGIIAASAYRMADAMLATREAAE
jgi:hypothetical protein